MPWTSSELVMPSTFPFTVITIIIHFVGSPVDTGYLGTIWMEWQKKRLRQQRQPCCVHFNSYWPSDNTTKQEHWIYQKIYRVYVLLTRISTWNWWSRCDFVRLRVCMRISISRSRSYTYFFLHASYASHIDPWQFLYHFYHLQFLHSWILLPNICSLSSFRFIYKYTYFFFRLLYLP